MNLETQFTEAMLQNLLERNDAQRDCIGWLKIGEACRKWGVRMPTKAKQLEGQAYLMARRA